MVQRSTIARGAEPEAQGSSNPCASRLCMRRTPNRPGPKPQCAGDGLSLAGSATPPSARKKAEHRERFGGATKDEPVAHLDFDRFVRAVDEETPLAGLA